MGFMGNYYSGPSPFAAALQQGVSGFFEGYAKMKGLGFEQSRIENEQRRTALQEQEMKDLAANRQQQYELSKQRLAQEEVGLEHQRFATKELQAGAARRKAKQEILGQQAKMGGMNEFGEPMQISDQIAQMQIMAQQLEAAEPGAGMPYYESAMRLMDRQTRITEHDRALEMQKAQIEQMRSQAEREQAKMNLMEQERKGVASHLMKNKNIIKQHTDHDVTGEEPLPVLLKLLEASNLAMNKQETDKIKLRQLQDLDTELRHIESIIENYITFKPEIANPNQAAQNALIADKIQELEEKKKRVLAEREFILTGRLPQKPVAAPMQREPEPEPERDLSHTGSPLEPSTFGRPRSVTGGMLSGLNDLFRGFSATQHVRRY